MTTKKKIIIASSIVLLAIGLTTFLGSASWNRFKKNLSSEMANGLEREVIIKTQTGEIIYQDTGKFDIEVNDNRVKYIDEEGKLHIVYLGASTAVVNEK